MAGLQAWFSRQNNELRISADRVVIQQLEDALLSSFNCLSIWLPKLQYLVLAKPMGDPRGLQTALIAAADTNT
jgi:hypothetical protein